MESPVSVAKRGSGSANSKESEVELVNTIEIPGESPEEFSKDDVMKDGVTQLLMTLNYREQQVKLGAG